MPTRKHNQHNPLDLCAPTDLGLPEKFDSWRPGQTGAIMDVVNDPHRFVVLAMPTGTGKSLVYGAIAELLIEQGAASRLAVLHSTKGLMDQFYSDFPMYADIRGKSNYQCEDNRGVSCDEGAMSCRAGKNCPAKIAYSIACASQRVNTNYAYWFNVNRYTVGLCLVKDGEPTNPIDLLVLDEAHAAEQELSDFLQITIRRPEIKRLLGEKWDKQARWVKQPKSAKELKERARAPKQEQEWGVGEWADWANQAAGEFRLKVDEALEEGKNNRLPASRLKEVKQMVGLLQRLSEVAAMGERESLDEPGSATQWVSEVTEVKGQFHFEQVQFDPVWPGAAAERYLFRGAKKVVLVSATMRPKTCGLLGIAHNKYSFREYPYVFRKSNAPIYYVPCVALSFRTGEAEMRKWVEAHDEFMGPRLRLGRKGIVHTGSYYRQRYLYEHSKYREYMVLNHQGGEETTSACVQGFKKLKGGRALISPSVTTGYDFEGDAARWQIISKIPFVEGQSRVMQERKRRDPSYPMYLAMQTLVQTCGRIVRGPEDWGETVILDDQWKWFGWQNKGFAPGWFEVRQMARMPEPMKER